MKGVIIMAISGSEIQFFFSTKSGSSGNSLTSNGDNSLGKYISTTQLSSGVLHDLFAAMTGDENASSGVVDYRLIFVANRTASSGYVMQNPVMWLQTELSGYSYTQIALDITQPSSISSATAQADSITTRVVAPTLIGNWNSGTAKTGANSGLYLPNIASGYAQGIWIRRASQNSAAVNSDYSSYVVSADSSA